MKLVDDFLDFKLIVMITENLNIDYIISKLDKNNEKFWAIKLVHASGHGGQNINHGNSKAQLSFDINKFFETFEISDDKRDKFVEVFGPSKIHHNNSVVVLENQETRYANKNKEKVLSHLKSLLRQVLEEEKDKIETVVPFVEKEKRIKAKKHKSKKKKDRFKNNIIE